MNPQEAARCAERLRAEIIKRRNAVDLDDTDALEDLLFAAQYVNADNLAVRALARALVEAAMASNSLRDSFDLSKLDERVKVRHQAVKKTQILLRLLNEWRALVQPIVDDNIVRNKQLGRAAMLLHAHRIPALVDLVSSMSMPLEDLTQLIQHQLTYPASIAVKRGAPAKKLRNILTKILRDGGFSHSEVAYFVDGKKDAVSRERSRRRAARVQRTPEQK